MQQKDGLFRRQALEHATVPSELEGFVHAVRPRSWLLVVASIIAMAALLVWGVTGKVATTVVDSGVVRDGAVFCYLNERDFSLVSIGDRAVVDGQEARVAGMATTPDSRREAERLADDDYTASMLKLEDWNYEIYLLVDNDLPEGALVPITITTDEVAPLDFVFGTSSIDDDTSSEGR